MIGIIDIGICNLRSVANAVYQLGHDPVLVRGAAEIGELSHCILPGVGSFRVASERLHERGLASAIQGLARGGRPVLGICLGMQLLAEHGDEGGGSPGLSLVPGVVRRLEPSGVVRVPHVGWNNVALRATHPVFDGVLPKRDFYFVHAYHLVAAGRDNVLGETEHGVVFTSAVASGSVLGVQFHPEKSQINGLRLLENFCAWDGRC